MNFFSICIAVLLICYSLVTVHADPPLQPCLDGVRIYAEAPDDGSCGGRHGRLLGSTTTPGTIGTRTAISLNSCAPDGNVIVRGKGKMSDTFTVQVGTTTLPGVFNPFPSVADSCPSGSYYAHTHLNGNGAVSTTTEVTVVATGDCVPVTYYLTLGNPTCSDAPSNCLPSVVSVAATNNVNTPLVTISGSELLLTPTTHVLSTSITGNAIVLTLPTVADTTYTISYSTLDPSTNQWSTPVVVLQNVAGGNQQVTWSPDRINQYIVDVSSTADGLECSADGFIVQVSNDLVVVDSSSSSSGSDIHIGVSSSSSEQTGGGIGDPQFVGLRGQSFQIHGYDGAVFNIISNKHFQLNSLFVFLTGPRPCPIMPSGGQESVACWSHDGSYLGDLGLKTNMQDELYVKPGSAAHGFDRVTFNNRAVEVDDEVIFEYEHDNILVLPSSSVSNPRMNQGKIHRISTHELVIEVSSFTMEIENVDGFVNIRRLGVIPESRSASVLNQLSAHGLLGQTWQLRRYTGPVKEIEGGVDDYVVEDGLFGQNFIYNRLALK